MRIRINLEIMDDHYEVVKTIPPVEALFDSRITEETVLTAQQLLAEAIERHLRSKSQQVGLTTN